MAEPSLNKREAGYIGDPGTRIHCASCRFFDAPNRCYEVKGSIDPNGCCNLWTQDIADIGRYRWISGAAVRRQIDG